MSDSLYSLRYAAGFGTSVRIQGVIQAGLSSSVESRGFWLGPSHLSLLRMPFTSPAPFSLGSLFSPASVFTWHSAILHL